MSVGYCPDCDEAVEVGSHPKKGHQVTCENCGAFLEVASTGPIELDWAFDDDDDDYEDDDDY